MANFEGKSRSNYFRVKNLPAFLNWLQRFDLRPITIGQGDPLVGFIADRDLPTADPDTDEEIDFVMSLADHLVEDQVAIVMEVGSENLRYLSGNAWAINHRGETETISLYDIHAQARKLGKNVTDCEY